MLKIKNIFLIFFTCNIFLFACIFYFNSNSFINFLLLKQYEQKIKTLKDVLNSDFFKINNLNEIKNFAEQSRSDFIIKHNDIVLSSLENYQDYIKLKQDDIINFNHKKILIKHFSNDKEDYYIVVYPRFNDVYNFWIKMLYIFLLYVFVFFILVFYIGRKFNYAFDEVLKFLDFIQDKKELTLHSSLFQEINFITKKLKKIKSNLLKKEQKNKKQNEKIALKNTQLSNVISAISHELKNPLSVIDLSLEMLKNQNADMDFKEELLNKISRQSKKLNQLTYKLNFVFNLNDENLQMQQCDLFELCQKITQNVGYERVVLKGKSTFAKIDAFLIEQVIINLLSNALKYSDKEVILTVENQKVSVEDFGLGISQDQIKLITKKFYKVDTKSDNSFGLGLFLVKKILSMHQSYLEISSIPKQGSIFSFTIR